jgi:hypothetical protein
MLLFLLEIDKESVRGTTTVLNTIIRYIRDNVVNNELARFKKAEILK